MPSNDWDSNSGTEEQEKALSRKGKGKSKGVKVFEQRVLVARAFAGDNVVQVRFWFYLYISRADLLAKAFEDVKRREIAEDPLRIVDITIPGWVRTFLYKLCIQCH